MEKWTPSFENIRLHPRNLLMGLVFFGAFSCKNATNGDASEHKLNISTTVKPVDKTLDESAKTTFDIVANQDIVSVGKDAISIDSKKELIEEIKNQKSWLLNYINSDMYKSRLIIELGRTYPDQEGGFLQDRADEIIKERKGNLTNGKYDLRHQLSRNGQLWTVGAYGPKKDTKVFAFNGEETKYKEGKYNPPKGDVYVEESLYTADKRKGKETTPIHELTHQSTDADAGILPSTKKDMDVLMKDKDDFIAVFKDKESGVLFSYIDDPTEVLARINALRYLLDKYHVYDSKKEVFTEEHLNSLLKIKEIREDNNVKDLFEDILETKEGLIWLMNNIAQIDNVLNPNDAIA